MSTVDSRAYNIELHTLNWLLRNERSIEHLSWQLNIDHERLQFINRADNPNFSFNNPVVLCNMAFNDIAPFVTVRSNVDPCILQSWMLSSLKSRPNPPKIMGCRSEIWRQRKFPVVSRHSFPRAFVLRNLINIDLPRLMEANNRQLNNLRDTLLQVADRLTSLQHQNIHEGRAVCSVIHLSHAVCKIIFLIIHLLDSLNIASSKLTITIFSALDLFYAHVLFNVI